MPERKRIMTTKKVSNFLYGLAIGEKSKPGTLRHLLSIVGAGKPGQGKRMDREQMIGELAEYYCAPGRFEQLWGELSEAERKIISFHIWSDGMEPIFYADAIADESGLKEKTGKDQRYLRYHNGLERFKARYAANDSVIWLLYPQYTDESVFSAELRGAVGKMKRIYTNVVDGGAFFSREDRKTDFINIVRFCNVNKVTVTKRGFLSKAWALKLIKHCGYEEYADDIDMTPETVRTVQGMLVTVPLTILCVMGGLLRMEGGKCTIGDEARSLVGLPHEQLIRRLFDAYLKDKEFDEIMLMSGLLSERVHQPERARKNIVKELKHCPVGQFVHTGEFERNLRMADEWFARRELRHVMEKASGYYYGYSVDWEGYEHPLIGIILGFFCALGIIDVVWGNERDDYYIYSNRVPVAFRINALGAYILGLSDSYTPSFAVEPKTREGFVVLPDYTVIVPESVDRVRHELMFEKRLTKVSSNEEAVIYKLDFPSIVRAMDDGLSVADLRNYLAASDKPIPDNVARALDDWERQAGRIRLRKVTILECEDDVLLEEVIRYKGMDDLIVEKVPAAAVVDGKATKAIKKIIEKNKRFCRDVI